ncbi:MAG TPA: sulfite exporter TauE/SafE family protein, partial [Spongiibacteraceae bacterium]|nr:sulfite exporter TauE/SafE family protein [Spongiibacteraceae bacterium]
LPIIALQLLFFSSTIWLQNLWNGRSDPSKKTSVDWVYLKKALAIMIVPKLLGVLGLLTIPAVLMGKIIFTIVGFYAVSYIINRPIQSRSNAFDVGLLVLGAYVSGTSLIGAPLIMIVFTKHVARHQLRDTLFALWFILVCIKMLAFLLAGVDLQLTQQLWLLPCAAIGHIAGLRFHHYILKADQRIFFRILGSVLLVITAIGLWKT